jgi:hypothetical protein
MSLRLLAASVIAAAQLAGATAVPAAELYPPHDPSRPGSSYDDRRYGDIEADPPLPYAEPRSHEPYDLPYGRRNPDPYLAPMPYPPRFSDYPSRYWRHGQICVPKHEIKRELTNQGWGDFHDLEIRGEVALVRARRPNGRLFEVHVDRCTGEIVHGRRLDDGYGAYAWRRRTPHPAY